MIVSFFLLCMSHEHVYLYTYVIHCWNGCTDMFDYCVRFVILNKKTGKKLLKLNFINSRPLGKMTTLHY